MANIENLAQKLWTDLEGFTPPDCPCCGNKASLDDSGYWCERCAAPDEAGPWDDIPNGSEFAELFEAWKILKNNA